MAAVRQGWIRPRDDAPPDFAHLPRGPLTERQHRILLGMLAGDTQRQVGRALGLTVATVRHDAGAAYKLLGVHDHWAAARELARIGGAR
jgi:DNA-binding NarL/FixJ family response regulator